MERRTRTWGHRRDDREEGKKKIGPWAALGLVSLNSEPFTSVFNGIFAACLKMPIKRIKHHFSSVQVFFLIHAYLNLYKEMYNSRLYLS